MQFFDLGYGRWRRKTDFEMGPVNSPLVCAYFISVVLRIGNKALYLHQKRLIPFDAIILTNTLFPELLSKLRF